MEAFSYSIYVTVEAVAGSNIGTTSVELVALAKRLGIGVECKFNDVTLLVGPDTDAEKLTAAFFRESDSEYPHKVATGWR